MSQSQITPFRDQGTWFRKNALFISALVLAASCIGGFYIKHVRAALPTLTVSSSMPVKAQPVLYVQAQAPHEPLQAEVLILSRGGFNKSAINRPRGRFILHVENRSGADDIDIQLKKAEDGRVLDKQLEKHNRKQKGVVSLPPGDYLLSVVDHPEWVCRVTITAN